jgi:hypothetical protein
MCLQGGFGEVYRGRIANVGSVAVKVLKQVRTAEVLDTRDTA